MQAEIVSIPEMVRLIEADFARRVPPCQVSIPEMVRLIDARNRAKARRSVVSIPEMVRLIDRHRPPVITFAVVSIPEMVRLIGATSCVPQPSKVSFNSRDGAIDSVSYAGVNNLS